MAAGEQVAVACGQVLRLGILRHEPAFAGHYGTDLQVLMPREAQRPAAARFQPGRRRGAQVKQFEYLRQWIHHGSWTIEHALRTLIHGSSSPAVIA
jgi:hypothetical protein